MEPASDKIRISLKDFEKYNYFFDITEAIRPRIYRAGFENHDYIYLSKEELNALELRLKQFNADVALKCKVYALLAEGKELEANGEIGRAIETYIEVANIGYNGPDYAINRPYDRLMILYRKNKDAENEIQIIRQCIKILLEDNSERANLAIEKHLHKKEEIISALPICKRVMGDNGFYCFIPYDVTKYRNRLSGLLKKKKKNRSLN